MPITDLALARRLEAAEASMRRGRTQTLARMRPQSGAAAEPVGGGWAIFGGPGSPGNCAVGLGMKGPVLPAELDRLEDFYRSRNAPVVVELCPLADPSLLDLLGNRGYRLTGFTTALVHPLPPDVPSPAPLGLEARLVGPDEVDSWARTVALGFLEGKEVTEDTLEMVLPVFQMPHVACLVAEREGQSVGGGAVALHEGVALLFGASTRSEFRGHGAQRALLGARMDWAARAGCDLALVMAVPGSGSQRNVERLGFRIAYTRVTLVRRW